MRYSRVVSVAGLMTVAALVIAGCSKKSTTEPSGNPALVGSYDLLSFTGLQMGTLEPPDATGTATLTDSTYTFHIVLPGFVYDDSGTYTVSGNSITQTSAIAQSVGTYTLANDTLTVDVTNATAGEIITVWLKQ